MQKQYLLFISALIISILTAGFVSCSGNDDNDDENISDNRSVVGTWSGYRCDDEATLEISENHTLSLVFKSDGSGDYYEKDGKYIYESDLTYEMKSSTRGKVYASARGTFYFKIVGGRMYIYGNESETDLDFLLSR